MAKVGHAGLTGEDAELFDLRNCGRSALSMDSNVIIKVFLGLPMKLSIYTSFEATRRWYTIYPYLNEGSDIILDSRDDFQDVVHHPEKIYKMPHRSMMMGFNG
jgi:hypothetical protein